jgi:hypothetical protein
VPSFRGYISGLTESPSGVLKSVKNAWADVGTSVLKMTDVEQGLREGVSIWLYG